MNPRFRVWDKKHREMIDMESVSSWNLVAKTISFVDDEDEDVTLYEGEFEVLLSSGQYDNDRTEIYTLDVAELSDGETYLVDWNQGGSYFYLIGRDDETPGADRLLVEHLGWIKIVGNICQHPELVEAQS